MVILYTTSWCGYCREARAFLLARNIPFREYDIEQDAKAMVAMQVAGGRRGVPFAIINGSKLHGFSQDAYMQALGRR